ncbi:MAG: NADH-quinone oxidoreductase subunit N [Bacteroidota bacterium]|nr:NADH-quinone oxidoreductase subunit N [Bacteroidota bacterium]
MNTLILLSCLGIATLFTGIYNLRKLIIPVVIAGLLAALGFIIYDAREIIVHGADVHPIYSNMLYFDRYSLVFTGLLIVITLLLFLFCEQEHRHEESHIADSYGLILFSLVGGLLLSSYWNLAMLFLGIEILSIPMYVLAGTRRKSLLSNEASIKYFIMGAFSTGFLLFGIALIYGTTLYFDLSGIRDYVMLHRGSLPLMFTAGLLLMVVGLGFKISAVPFHFWAPDVYEGSPTWVTSYMATAVKVGAFAAFFRLFYHCFDSIGMVWETSVWIIAALTITLGNLVALYQKSVKRMLAYSGIANAGYLLLALLVMSERSADALFYYLAAYSLATLGAFAVLMVVEKVKDSSEYAAFSGLAHTNPLLAAAMTVSMLSLAGIPPLAGFFGKYYLFANAVQEGYIWIVVLAVINSLAGIYYYFKIIVAMFSKETFSVEINLRPAYTFALFLVAILTLIAGILPQLVLSLL